MWRRHGRAACRLAQGQGAGEGEWRRNVQNNFRIVFPISVVYIYRHLFAACRLAQRNKGRRAGGGIGRMGPLGQGAPCRNVQGRGDVGTYLSLAVLARAQPTPKPTSARCRRRQRVATSAARLCPRGAGGSGCSRGGSSCGRCRLLARIGGTNAAGTVGTMCATRRCRRS